MKILITGNNGYVGPILENLLISGGHDITGLDTDFFQNCLFYEHKIEKRQIVRDIRLIEEGDLNDIDAVIHLSALSNDPMGEMDEHLTEQINFHATKRLADLCKKKGIQRFIMASSCSMYGVSEHTALTEESPLNPKTAYAKSKVNSEKYLSSIADDSFSPTFLRFSTAYGVSPRIRVDIVLNNLVAWGFTTGKIKIMSDGTPWRPIIHVEDMAHAFLSAVEAPIASIHNQAFNVGKDDNNYQVRDMADAVKKIVPDCEVVYTNEHGGDSRTYNVSFEKINRVLPQFKPQWNLERGVEQLYKEFKRRGFTLEDLEGERYTRLIRLKNLKESGKLDTNLYWQ
ncbi:MAG: SDR family oxidoreductase [Candidatus Brocadiaceae bacterium]|nr:SDR family oxidoreductase [Candidatus Brocadiaceae bacterium]